MLYAARRIVDSQSMGSHIPNISEADLLQSAMHAVGLPTMQIRQNSIHTFPIPNDATLHACTASDVIKSIYEIDAIPCTSSDGMLLSLPPEMIASDSPSVVRLVVSQSLDDLVPENVTPVYTIQNLAHDNDNDRTADTNLFTQDS